MTMMLADIAFGVCALVGLAVGAKLLRLYSRTREVPELVLGIATSGQVLAALGFWAFPQLLPEGSIWAGAAFALFMEAVGSISLCIGCWVLFRRGEAWARLAAGGVSLGILGLTGVRLAMSHPELSSPAMPLGHGDDLALAQALTNLGVIAAYGWAAFEATRYGLRMQRRLKLGVDHPIVADQFLLWGVACASIVVINVLVVAVLAVTGRPEFELPWAHGLIALLGFVGALALWSAFFPSRAHRAWAERRREALG